MLENVVAWQNYLADKQLQELPSLPKKERKFKLLTNKVKNRIKQVKEITREKFNALFYKRVNSMKLEYQAIKFRRGDKWHCNFCSFERERSLAATYKIVSYNTNNNDYNDIAYICVEYKKALD